MVRQDKGKLDFHSGGQLKRLEMIKMDIFDTLKQQNTAFEDSEQSKKRERELEIHQLKVN